MKLAVALLVGVITLNVTAIAHEEPIKKAIGFIHLQDFHDDRPTHRMKRGDIDPTQVPRGVLLYKDTWRSAKLKAFNYIQLKSTNVGNKLNPMAYVFDKKLGWYQLGTDEGQYLWAKKIDTSGYISFKDILNDSCFYLDIASNVSDHPVKVSKNLDGELVAVRTWGEVLRERVFSVKEIRETLDEIWINLTPHWYEPWHSNTKLKKDDDVFKSSRWTTAHGLDGLITLAILDNDCF